MDDPKEDNRPFSSNINKRPHKKNKLNPNKHTGISNQVIPANQLENPTWDRKLNQWVEGPPPTVYEEEPKYQFPATTEIRGRVKDNFFLSRTISKSKLTPWHEVYVGDPNQSRPYRGEFKRQSRQPSHSRRLRHSRPLGHDGGRRTHKHKRKNKHTRRRGQRRRA